MIFFAEIWQYLPVLVMLFSLAVCSKAATVCISDFVTSNETGRTDGIIIQHWICANRGYSERGCKGCSWKIWAPTVGNSMMSGVSRSDLIVRESRVFIAWAGCRVLSDQRE